MSNGEKDPRECPQPETRELYSEAQFSEAWRLLQQLGFRELGACTAPGYRTSTLVAPDGYRVRLLFDARPVAS